MKKPKTGRKYRDSGKLTSDIRADRTRDWRTRDDPFDDVWDKALPFLENNKRSWGLTKLISCNN
jgi:hypothetical protein